MKTLALRFSHQSQSALRLGEFLEKHPRVERVFFPGLKRHAKHALTKQFRASGLIMPSHSRARRPSWHGRLRHAQVRSPLPTGVAPVARTDELWRGKEL